MEETDRLASDQLDSHIFGDAEISALIDEEEVSLKPAEKMSDRLLLEYIVDNMLTTDRLVQAIVEQLPVALAQIDNSPTARALLKLFL